MLANLLHVAGIGHVITVDLHASQMQGFFKCPVDNLHAEPLIAKWIRRNVVNWEEAVCISKNAGGTKRVTSLADALKLNFGMVTTDRKRGGANMSSSMIMKRLDGYGLDTDPDFDVSGLQIGYEDFAYKESDDPLIPHERFEHNKTPTGSEDQRSETSISQRTPPKSGHVRQDSQNSHRRVMPPSPLRSAHPGPPMRSPLIRAHSTPAMSSPIGEEEEIEFTDELAQDVTQGRLVRGHVVPDDYPSPTISAMSSSMTMERVDDDPMEMSRASSFFAAEAGQLGGSADAADTSDEEEDSFKDPGLEQMITLVGDVRNRTVLIIDDMIDKAGSWIAAAECCVKRGRAKKVYCIATHGLFGGESLEELNRCDCIDQIIVTNSFPISPERARNIKKLVILDLSSLLAEAIRRNHYGESISALFAHHND